MVTSGALWLSGCYWLVLHYFFSQASEFGPVQSSWAPSVLRIHGWIAVASVFLLGWVTARHVSDRWYQTQKRVSGLSMVSVAALLALTGYALYYTTDGLHDVAADAHEALGAAAVIFSLIHWRRRRSVRRSPFLAGAERP
jgi:fucose 4-O-acetylase-like acetyltransferase